MTVSKATPTAEAAPARARYARHRPLTDVNGWDLAEQVWEGPLTRAYRARPAGAAADRPAAYVVKVLRRRWWDRPEAVAIIRREACVGMSVSNRHLISVLAAGVDRPPYHVVMPRLDGQTLAERLAQPVEMDLPVALWTARQVAEAVHALHSAGWTHGDVKPDNIFIAPEGHVTLLDLGFARRPEETTSAARRVVMGTCRYIAPEAITSTLATDVRSDIYSLGAVLFEILSGRPPFQARGLAELATEHRTARPPELRKLVPHLPGDVTRLVGQMLAKHPLRRPQTPAELIDRLAALEIATFTERSF